MNTTITTLSVFVCCCLATPHLEATELRPWFSRDLQFVFRETVGYESFGEVARCGDQADLDRGGYRWFAASSLSLPILDTVAVETELDFADSSEHSFSLSSFQFTGRYHYANDIVGDPMSVVIGVTLRLPTNAALSDFTQLAHSKLEGEIHLSLGKECTCWDSWSSRIWAVGVFGIGERNATWVRTKIAYEWHLGCEQRFGLFGEWLANFKGGAIDLTDFKGYGDIRYRAGTIGCEYHRPIFDWGDLTAEYAYRPYASNFPKKLYRFLISLSIPFNP
ncbi:MAG: hypothetical protein KDK40_00650 [Chlamydiia bacterium]|nr:hypothetical protein [Chlamydiia bacterium]